MDAVAAEGLVKHYGETKALDGLDLDVPRGTVLGLLGPNGAGKTTAVRVLTTLLVPDAGSAFIDGLDVIADPQAVRGRIGLTGQYAAVDEILTATENLVMVGRLYGLNKSVARERAGALLDRFRLDEAAHRPVKGFSGGMRRRLDLAAALVASPPVLFLDEPTTGLDPRSRIELWDVIRELVTEGSTLLLTTQYLEEADQLADEIVVIDKGRAIATGTADELKAEVGGERLEITTATPEGLDRAVALVTPHTATGDAEDIEVRPATRTLLAPVSGGIATMAAVVEALDGAELTVTDIGLRRPTLDDVFLTLTGHATTSSDDDTTNPEASE